MFYFTKTKKINKQCSENYVTKISLENLLKSMKVFCNTNIKIWDFTE